MTTFPLTTLRTKISVFIIVLLIVTAFLFTFLTVQSMNQHIVNEIIKRAEALSKNVASVAAFSILSGDMLAADNVAWKVKEANPDIVFTAVVNSGMEVLAHTDVSRIGGKFLQMEGSVIKETADGTRVFKLNDNVLGFQVVTPMVFNNKEIGNVVIGINKSVLNDAKKEMVKRVALGLLIILFLGAACIFVLSSYVTRPIKELAKGVDDLTMGKRSRLQVYSSDELGRLTVNFNHLADLTSRQQAKLKLYAQELEDSYISTIKVLIAAIDARDAYTLGHSTRVAKLAVKIGEAIGLPRQELEDLEISSLFHDVGKLKTPDDVLMKTGPLDRQEQREVSSHCEYGAAILSRAASLHKYIPAVRHHHEWFNGDGYPDGLRGEDIPLHASIIAIADAFDAMTSNRPYKRSFSREDAVLELISYSGRQFNPWLVDVFQSVLDSDPLLAEQFSGRG